MSSNPPAEAPAKRRADDDGASKGNEGKRARRDNYKGKGPARGSTTIDPRFVNSEVVARFKTYQEALDERNDRHERLVKASRDVTILSKRIIFTLQRSANDETRASVVEEAQEKLAELHATAMMRIAEELSDDKCDPLQCARAYSPGLQEYIEAVSFLHYIQHQKLISRETLEEQLKLSKPVEQNTDEADDTRMEPPQSVPVSVSDYVLGIADLTGELMRLSIAFLTVGNRVWPKEICQFVRSVHDSCAGLDGFIARDMAAKMRVMRASLRKIEQAVYTMHVRGSEIPEDRLAEMMMSMGDGGGGATDE